MKTKEELIQGFRDHHMEAAIESTVNIAYPVFQRLGWEYATPGGKAVPSRSELVRSIGEWTDSALDGLARSDHGVCVCGRLMVTADFQENECEPSLAVEYFMDIGSTYVY